jgi:hypothetical protein
MKVFTLLTAVVFAAVLSSLTLIAQSAGTPVSVYKDPSCGCCSKWAEHLVQNGFAPRTIESTDMEPIKDRHHVPQQARSCHTALVAGYVIEGHVPAADIRRLLKERPPGIVGLAVPGMPVGSPGMEVPGANAQPFDVVAFDKAGRTRVFASHK